MVNCLIFFPNFDSKKHSSLLFGVVSSYKTGIAVYILGSSCSPKCDYLSRYEVLGEISSYDKAESVGRDNSNFWISIKLSPSSSNIERISVESKVHSYDVTVILCNKESIKKSQLLKTTYRNTHPKEKDYLYCLIHNVQNQPAVCCVEEKIRRNFGFVDFSLQKLLFLLEYLLCIMRKNPVKRLCNVSSFGSHFFNIVDTFACMIEQILKEKYLNIRFMNYFIARICDAILGQIIIYYVLSYTTSHELFIALTQSEEFIVSCLKNTVEWLMGSPAGLKLYCPLNNILGSFCQFHISLWWTFLNLLSPFLKVAFNFFLILGNFGFSFQVSMLADLLAIVSVHMYCIYVYASRLYFFQMKGLKILSRLFIGKKRSPLPGSVHSSPYTTEQLLFGTVSFTILLFLLPTTLVYYSVFTGIRIILIFMGGFLTRLKYLMNIFPIYLTFLWFYNPITLTTTMRVNMKADYFPDGTLVNRVKPVWEPWLKTVEICVPKTIQKPDQIEWRKLTADVLVGNLIYTV